MSDVEAEIGPREVARMTGMDSKTVVRWENTGKLPKANRRGLKNARRWPAHVIELWIEDQKKNQDFRPAPPDVTCVDEQNGD